jgi:maltose-binding protein MalE
MKAVEGSGTQAMVEQGAWAISNLCRGNPKPKYSLIKSAIPMLAKLVMSGILK